MCRLLLCNAASLRHLEAVFESAQDALTGGPLDLEALRRPPITERRQEGHWRWLPPSSCSSRTEEQQ